MTRGWAIIDSFRRVGLAGIPYAKEIVAAEHASFIADLTASGKLGEIFIGAMNTDDLHKTGAWLRGKLTEQALKNAACSIDAASFVFAHTILDDGLSSFVEITSAAAPTYRQKRVERKNVSIAVLKNQPLEEVLQSVIAKEVWETRRNASLPEKCDLLHAICQPHEGTLVHPEYKFDLEIVSMLDKLRQDLVHGDLLGEEIANAENRLDYLRQTWMYFFIMLHKKFGLRIDPVLLSASGKGGTKQ